MEIYNFIQSNLFQNVSHKETLLELIKTSKKIQIVSPFISMRASQWLIDCCKNEKDIEIITEINLNGIVSNVQSPDVLKYLCDNGCKVRYWSDNLHAKIYFFDGKNALITSANLTENGLSQNFELGVLAKEGYVSLVNSKQISVGSYVKTLWNFIYDRSFEFNVDLYDYLKEKEDEINEVRAKYKEMVNKIKIKLPENIYQPFQKDILNKQNIQTEIKLTKIFKGFEPKNWDPFDLMLELNDENLKRYRLLLNEQIDPVLEKFYLQLKNEPTFTKNLPPFNIGFSRNMQLKSRFPNSRYMYLSKNEEGKKLNKHIGEPSFIICMGKRKEEGKFLEVRVGVEEETLQTGLSVSGEIFLRNLIQNKNVVVQKLQSLSSNWKLGHGSNANTFAEIPANEVTTNNLLNICNSYLQTKKVADLCIRKIYFINQEQDAKEIFDSQVTRIISKDFEILKFFFDLCF